MVRDLPDFLRDNAALYSACVAGAISEPEYLQGLAEAGLEAGVTERLVYEESQLVSLISSEIPGLELDEELVKQIAPTVAGKVWSAKIAGRRVG